MKTLLIFLSFLILSCNNHKKVVKNDNSISNCSEIKDFLESHNWRKHSSEKCYVIDKTSLLSFANFLNKNKCEISTADELRRIFGDETYNMEPSEKYREVVDSLVIRLFLFKIVGIDSLDIYEQDYLEYSFKEKNGKIEFVSAYMLGELEESDH